MTTEILDNDITLFYITADSFPEGITAAHERIVEIVPFSPDRKYIAFSRPEGEDCGIVYHVGQEEKEPGEAEKYGCKRMVIPAGTYVTIDVPDFRSDLDAIGRTFGQLMDTPGLDPHGYCLEWYLPDDVDVKCMIRLEDK